MLDGRRPNFNLEFRRRADRICPTVLLEYCQTEGCGFEKGFRQNDNGVAHPSDQQRSRCRSGAPSPLRQYGAFVTTAPPALDSSATVTLHGGPLADVIGLAADPITLDELRARTPARLVLIDAKEFIRQRASYREHRHLLLRADPGLVGLNTLQLWLWQRLLQASSASSNQVAA